jgi:hypothetical protein
MLSLDVKDNVTRRRFQIAHILDGEDCLFRWIVHFPVFILDQDEASLIQGDLLLKRKRGCANRIFEV